MKFEGYEGLRVFHVLIIIMVLRVMSRVTENSVSTIEFYRLFLIKCNGLC